MANYQEKLSDPRWQKKRLKIFERDNWTCRKCGDQSTTLAIHHLYYLDNTDPWDYPDDALLTLCKTCHDKESFLQIGLSLIKHTCYNCYHVMGAYCSCREVVDIIRTPDSCPDWYVKVN